MAHCTHLFSTILMPSTHPKFSEACYSECSACSNVLLLHRKPRTTEVLPRSVHDFYRKLHYRKLSNTKEFGLFTSKVAILE